MKAVIYVYGASGSGTSTLGKAIAEHYGYRQLDTDDYFWLPTDPPFVTSRERPERLRLLREDMDASQRVVISGSFYDWGDCFFPRVTLGMRIAQLKERKYARFGERIREGGMYKHHLEFIQWAKGYDFDEPEVRSKQGHDREEQGLCCPVVRVDGTRPVEKTLAAIAAFLKGDGYEGYRRLDGIIKGEAAGPFR